MTANGLYVYGLMRSAQARELGQVGLEHEGAPARVYPVPVDGVAAIVSAWQPAATSLADAGKGLTSSFEPITGSAMRAVNMFRRDSNESKKID